MRRRWEEGRVQWSVMAEDEEKRKEHGRWGKEGGRRRGKTERKKKKCMFLLPDNDDLTVV